MQILSSQVQEYTAKSSMIRQMFEAGIELKKKYGQENVYDFSLGNPDLPPPPAVGKALAELAVDAGRPFAFGYMPNAGALSARQTLAGRLRDEQQSDVTADHLVLTVGAAGGMNAFFRAVLNPGDEVVCPAPYFVEYGFYAQNYGGCLRPVPATETFDLDLAAIEAAITPATRVVLVNSPNNPTGKIYSLEQLRELGEILMRKSRENNRPVYLLGDEPYRFLAFDGQQVPPLLPLYPYTVIVSSFSKNLSLAGERIGYLLLNPRMPQVEELHAGLVLTNRILGFVNAPSVGQYLAEHCLHEQTDKSVYEERRAAMAEVLDAAGLSYSLPQGAFYFFPRVPYGLSDSDFVALLQEQRILAVPGSGFGCPGYFRLSFSVQKQVIEASRQSFIRAVARAKEKS